MKNIIVVLLLTAAVMGQTQTIRNQKACYDQAAKVEKDSITKNGGSFSNHFDPRTKMCWVEEFSNFGTAPVTYYRSVYNAFEPSELAEASFAGELGKKPGYCWVGDKECHTINEFDMLVSQRYGLK